MDILIILYTIVILIVIIFIIKTNNEGFFGYHPGHPTYPWYWYNYPTRLYVPTRNMVTDIRGDPRSPYFSKCGSDLRSGKVIMHPKIHSSNYLWWNPPLYPNFYYYDYYYPIPNFNYSKRYGIDGSLYKIKEEKIKTAPTASN